jgi:PAS domain S-box-containing protein
MKRTSMSASVPETIASPFRKAQEYVERYFRKREENPDQGLVSFSGERYILVRAASMSKEFFDMVTSLYGDRGIDEARGVAFGLLFDIAHSIGKADARSFSAKMGVTDPIERLSAGPIHFAHTGWAFVKILPESNPTPDQNYCLIYDHPFSFEAHAWLESGERSDFAVCIMNAGYSSGWCEESFGVPLVAAEIECRARGDEHCRFIMAPPSAIESQITRYCSHSRVKPADFGTIDVPEFFRRKRMEEELKQHRDHLEELVQRRTDRLTTTNIRLKKEISERNQAENALRKSETMLRAIFDQTFQFIAVLKLDGTVLKVNKTAMDFVGIEEKEILRKPFWQTPWWTHSDEGQLRLKKAVNDAADGKLIRYETPHLAPDGTVMHIDFSIKPVKDETGRIVLLIAEGRDISDFRRAMEELRKGEARLKTQSKHLEEANIALKVLLKQMEEKKNEEKEHMLSNVKQLVSPYLGRLKNRNLTNEERTVISTLETNLEKITSPLVSRLSSTFLGLTPMEIRVANLVKEGLMNKEIAGLLGTSSNTISCHRYKLRSKLGLKNKGINLRSYLLSLEE